MAVMTGRAVAALGIVALVGCASQQPKEAEVDPYGSLYSGKSELAYATQFPVGSAREAILRGDAAVASGDLDRALFEYIRALQKGGDNADVLYKIGIIHAARGNTGLAELAFRWALNKDPKHSGALTGLGILLTKKRDYAEAEKYLNDAVRINPNLSRAHNALGVLADMQRDYKRAQRHYQDALSAGDKSPEILNNLGYSRYLSGNRSGAVAAFNEALTIDPRYERAWRNLALVYSRDGKYQQALAALRKVEDLPKAYNDVGYVAMISGRLGDADAFFSEAMQISPEYYELANENEQRLRAIRHSR
jgi:Flp pilus assembly protein TadD